MCVLYIQKGYFKFEKLVLNDDIEISGLQISDF